MSRAVVTHFDGDPFTLNMWLALYSKYWRGECDKVYLTICHGLNVPPEVARFNEELICTYPEIDAIIFDHSMSPEECIQKILPQVKEEYIGLIESDGLVYADGVVDQCFRLLENEGQDIVAPPWRLIDEPYFNGTLRSHGFMRCFFFATKEMFDATDYDFLPHIVEKDTRLNDDHVVTSEVVLDCFGWMSWQMLLATDKITYLPTNVLNPSNILSPYSNFKFIHIRQMSSSAIGMGGGDFKLWFSDSPDLLTNVQTLLNEDFPDASAEFTYIKAVAFKLLFSYAIDGEKIEQFTNDYRQMLELVIDYYNLPREQVAQIRGFYKALLQV